MLISVYSSLYIMELLSTEHACSLRRRYQLCMYSVLAMEPSYVDLLCLCGYLENQQDLLLWIPLIALWVTNGRCIHLSITLDVGPLLTVVSKRLNCCDL